MTHYTAPDGSCHVYIDGYRAGTIYTAHNGFWCSEAFLTEPKPVRDHDGERIYLFLIDPETIMAQIDIDTSTYPSMHRIHHGDFASLYRIEEVDLTLLRLKYRVKEMYGENNAKA